jgi:hypothetical protein
MKKQVTFLAFACFSCTAALAQNPGIARGAQALSAAATDLQQYFEPVTTIIYVIAAVVGIVGGYRVYSKMQNGDQDVQKAAVGWAGSFLFLLSIAAILKAAFF